MGLFDFLKPKYTPDEFGAKISRAAINTLTSDEIMKSVVDPMTASGAPAHYNRIYRELLYLLQFANHVALVQHFQDPVRSTRILQECTDVLVPYWGSWESSMPRSTLNPEPDLPPIESEYLVRKEELLDAFESDDAADRMLERSESLAAVALSHIGPEAASDVESIENLSSLWLGQWKACLETLESVRIIEA